MHRYFLEIERVQWNESELTIEFEVQGDGSRGTLPKPLNSKILSPFKEFRPNNWVQKTWLRTKIDTTEVRIARPTLDYNDPSTIFMPKY